MFTREIFLHKVLTASIWSVDGCCIFEDYLDLLGWVRRGEEGGVFRCQLVDSLAISGLWVGLIDDPLTSHRHNRHNWVAAAWQLDSPTDWCLLCTSHCTPHLYTEAVHACILSARRFWQQWLTVGTIVVDKIHSVWIIIMLDTAGEEGGGKGS